MQLLEAYRRDFIDKDMLETGILQSRVRDEWIPVIEKLRYSPMTVADAVRAVVEHYLSDEEGAAIAQQNGLEPDHWKYLVESWGRPLALGQMMDLYNRGLIKEDAVKEGIRQSNIKNEYVDVAMGLSRRLVPSYQIVKMVSAGAIDKATAMQMFREWGYSDADSESYVKLGTAKATGHGHNLDKSDTISMYSDSLITRAQADTYLKALGYTDDVIKAMLDLADFKRNAALLRAKTRAVEAQLKAHAIDRKQAEDALISDGLDGAQARAYVDEWTTGNKAVIRSLTSAEILKAVEDQIIPPANGITRLENMGYSAPDIEILYKLKGILPTTTTPTIGA